MIQLCRFCSNIYLQDEDIAWCEVKKEMLDKEECSVANNCGQFDLNELDVFLEGVEGNNDSGWLKYDEYMNRQESPKWNVPDNNQVAFSVGKRAKECDTE